MEETKRCEHVLSTLVFIVTSITHAPFEAIEYLTILAQVNLTISGKNMESVPGSNQSDTTSPLPAVPLSSTLSAKLPHAPTHTPITVEEREDVPPSQPVGVVPCGSSENASPSSAESSNKQARRARVAAKLEKAWAQEASLSLQERRTRYHARHFVTLDDIPSWQSQAPSKAGLLIFF